MPLLQVDPTFRIQAGAYEAIISPSAGARLLQLSYRTNSHNVECLVPFNQMATIDAHHWPKAGAFAMLPFTNRLDPAEFEWQGRKISIHNGSHSGQGLHGFGHRSHWTLSDLSHSHLALKWSHAFGSTEWPWTFEANLTYSVSELGLAVALSVCNTDKTPMPVSLGWHPFIPISTSVRSQASLLKFSASHMHDIGLDGLGVALLSGATVDQRVFTMDAKTASTTAFENFSGEIEIFIAEKICLKLSSQNAPYLLVHRPRELTFVCVEPVGALPGALKNYTRAQSERELSLQPGQSRHLVCNLGVETTK